MGPNFVDMVNVHQTDVPQHLSLTCGDVLFFTCSFLPFLCAFYNQNYIHQKYDGNNKYYI